MDRLNILGIKRASRFSPNHILNDDRIFALVAKELEKKNCEVSLCSETDFLEQPQIESQYIFTMAREKAVVKKLQVLESQGKRVINSGYSIENCFRKNMTTILVENDIPYPKSHIVDTHAFAETICPQIPGKGFWIKRGDFHAIHKEDVTFVESIEQGNNILKEFAMRDIPDAVVSEHLYGDLVKFYGVRDTGFFHSFYPHDHNHLKYAENELVNGHPSHYAFDLEKLKTLVFRSAELLGIHIFGGDVIIGKDGSMHIIDMNDWPSFAPCYEEAVPHIAENIYRYFTVS